MEDELAKTIALFIFQKIINAKQGMKFISGDVEKLISVKKIKTIQKNFEIFKKMHTSYIIQKHHFFMLIFDV